MKPFFTSLVLRLAIVAVFSPALAFSAGAGPGASSAVNCIRAQIESRIESIHSRPQQVHARYLELQKACSQRRFNLCQDSKISDSLKRNILHAASQLDDSKVRAVFLDAFPPHSTLDLDRLSRYLAKRMEFCDPPIHHTCASDRWQLVIEDYLARNGGVPGAKFLARWNEDHLESRIPGLHDFLQERKGLKEFSQDSQAYQVLLQNLPTQGLTADSISIVSEQSMKKRLNDVNKGFSDALGETRLRSFRWHLAQELAAEGLALPNAVRVDFKTDRLIEPLLWMQQDHPTKLERAVNRAAAAANIEMTEAVQTRFPELMYITDLYEPHRWFNTATFSLPGYSPRLNEALASFKARKMRESPQLSNEDARDEFVLLAKNLIEVSDVIKRLDANGSRKLARAKIIDNDGAFTQKTAELIRKLKPGWSLSDAIEDAFKVKLTSAQERLILQQWHSQDMLSLPLVTIDKMPDAPKDAAILGGDGIAGGAIDAWTKVRALLDHRKSIMGNMTPDEQVKQVFNALVEADGNASAMIRSAPMLLKSAIESIPEHELKKLGMTQVLTSADDAVVPLKKLMQLEPKQRDAFYRQLTWNISNSARKVKLSQNGALSEEIVGPGILRAFLGHDKPSAEAAEQFLKPIEERLASAKFLGPHWRAQYPNVAFLSVYEDGETVKLIVAGKDIDENFKEKVRSALNATLRSPEHAQIQFVTNVR